MRLPVRLEYASDGIVDMTQHSADLPVEFVFTDGENLLDFEEAIDRIYDKSNEEDKERIREVLKKYHMEDLIENENN
jgi:hypothetical protein